MQNLFLTNNSEFVAAGVLGDSEGYLGTELAELLSDRTNYQIVHDMR